MWSSHATVIAEMLTSTGHTWRLVTLRMLMTPVIVAKAERLGSVVVKYPVGDSSMRVKGQSTSRASMLAADGGAVKVIGPDFWQPCGLVQLLLCKWRFLAHRRGNWQTMRHVRLQFPCSWLALHATSRTSLCNCPSHYSTYRDVLKRAL